MARDGFKLSKLARYLKIFCIQIHSTLCLEVYGGHTDPLSGLQRFESLYGLLQRCQACDRTGLFTVEEDYLHKVKS